MKIEVLIEHRIIATKFANWLCDNHYRPEVCNTNGDFFWKSPSSPNEYTEKLFELFLEDTKEFKYTYEAQKEKLNKAFDDFLKQNRPWYKKLVWVLFRIRWN